MANKTERLLSFYRQVLATVDLPVDDDGRIVYQLAGDEDRTPAAIDGKPWMLPLPEFLRERGFWEDHVPFHPMSENFLNGESVVLAKFKAAQNLKLGAVMAELMGWLVKFAANPEQQAVGTVGAKASKYLKLVPNIKEITAERIEEIIKRSEGSGDKRFVNLYLKRGGDLLDSRYQWVCSATFPFRQELEGEQPKVFGVTISKKDQQSFKALFDYILPENELLETYSAGSKIKSACKFDAVLRSFAKIAERINEVIALHRKVIPTYKNLTIDLSWMEELDHLDKLADIIPPLPFNEGEGQRDRRTEGGATSKAAPSSGTAAKGRRAFAGGGPTPDRAAVTARNLKSEPREQTSREEREEEHLPVLVKTERTRDERDIGMVIDPQGEPHPSESFSERLARMRQQDRRPASLYQGGATGYRSSLERGAYGRRDYSGTAEDRVPDWAQRMDGKSMVVAGDQPQQPDPRERWRSQRERPATSFHDRFSGGGRGGYDRGGRGGGYL